MKIIQLTSSDSGDHIGLYRTERNDNAVESDLKGAFELAINESEDSSDEWVMGIDDGYYLFEDGGQSTAAEFWKWRQNEDFDYDWQLFQE